MTTSPRQLLALKAFWAAKPEVQKVMLDQAQAYLTARVTILSALEQRVTQTTALMLAAAAVSATLAFHTREAGGLVVFAALGAVCFALGGGLCFMGVRPGSQLMPGVEPSHWSAAHDIANMQAADAGHFVIGLMQDTIDSMHAQGERRARWLARGLWCGMAGAACIACMGPVAAITAL